MGDQSPTGKRRDKTTQKLCSPMSVWKSTRPNKYRDAIIKTVALMDSEDDNVKLKAAVYIINQEKGSPGQSVDLTSGGDKLPTIPATLSIKIKE